MDRALRRLQLQCEDADLPPHHDTFKSIVRTLNYFFGNGRQTELCRVLETHHVLRKLITRNRSVLEYLCKARRRCVLRALVRMERSDLERAAPALLAYTLSKAVRGRKERVIALLASLPKP